MAEWAASGQSDRRFATATYVSNFTHSQPPIRAIDARLEPWPNNQGMADTTVIPTEVSGRYVCLAWELRFIQAEATTFSVRLECKVGRHHERLKVNALGLFYFGLV